MADRVSLNAWSFNAPSAHSHCGHCAPSVLHQLLLLGRPLLGWRMSPVWGVTDFLFDPVAVVARCCLSFRTSAGQLPAAIGPATGAKINWKLISCFDYRPWRTFYDLEYDTFVSSVFGSPGVPGSWSPFPPQSAASVSISSLN